MNHIDKKALTIIAGPDLVGGTPTKVLQLAQYSSFEHHVFFISDGIQVEKFDEQFAAFAKHAVCYDGRSCHYSYFKLLCVLNKVVCEQKIDIIHTYFVCESILGFLLKLLHPRVKLVISLVSAVKTKSFLRKILLSVALRMANGVIYISKAVWVMREQEFPQLKHRNGRIIYNGVKPKAKTGRLSEAQICPGKDFKIAYVGGFIEIKNHTVLVEAMRIVRDRYHINDIGCILIGGHGPYEATIRELVQKYDLQDMVQVFGPSNEVGDVLEASQIYAHPCVLEGFGIAVAEGMLAGLPVLLANACALPELITDGVEGRLLPPHDPEAWANAILDLYNNPEKRVQMGKASKACAEERFSIKGFVENHDRFYQDILAQK